LSFESPFDYAWQALGWMDIMRLALRNRKVEDFKKNEFLKNQKILFAIPPKAQNNQNHLKDRFSNCQNSSPLNSLTRGTPHVTSHFLPIPAPNLDASPTKHQHQYLNSLPARNHHESHNHAMTTPPQNLTIYPDYCHNLSQTIGIWCPLRATDIHALRKVGMFCDGLYALSSFPTQLNSVQFKVTGG
jgi:hypothetical protein